MVVVIVVTVGMTAFFANRATTAEVKRLQGLDDEARNNRLSAILSRSFLERGGWSDSQRILEQAGELYGQRMVLSDQSGRIVADSHGAAVGDLVDPSRRSHSNIPIENALGRLGALMVDPELTLEETLPSGQCRESHGPSVSLLLILS